MQKSWVWFVVKALLSLILIGLLVAGGFAIHYASWSQGYAAGELAAEGEDVAAPPPYVYHGFRSPGYLGFARPLLCVGGFLLLLVVAGGLFRALAWHKMWACGPWTMWHHGVPHWRRVARRAKHWRHYGSMPPWCWGWDKDEEAEEANKEPDDKG